MLHGCLTAPCPTVRTCPIAATRAASCSRCCNRHFYSTFTLSQVPKRLDLCPSYNELPQTEPHPCCTARWSGIPTPVSTAWATSPCHTMLTTEPARKWRRLTMMGEQGITQQWTVRDLLIDHLDHTYHLSLREVVQDLCSIQPRKRTLDCSDHPPLARKYYIPTMQVL